MRAKKEPLKKSLRVLIFSFAFVGAYQLFTNFSTTDKEVSEFESKMEENYKIYSLRPPNSILFADEQVPLNQPEVFERLDRELHSNTYFHSNTILYFKRAARWFPVIEPILEENNIPDDFKYLALIESGLQNIVSPAGATGFWQFMPKTGKEYGLTLNGEVDERYHVEKATVAACKYLNDAYLKYNSWALVAASYNAGMNKISKELNRQKASSYYDLLLVQETSRYVFRILAIKHIFENPTKFGFNIRKADLYNPLKYKTVEIDSSISSFPNFAKENNISYKTLKQFNPWLRDAFLKNINGDTYTIKLPAENSYLLN